MQFDPMEPMALLPVTVPSLVAAMRGERAERKKVPFATFYSGDETPLTVEDLLGVETASSKGLLAVVSLWGVLSPNGDYGGTSLDQFGRAIAMLDANPNVASILINCTSPGGTVTGTQETADIVRSVRDGGRTNIVALANGMMASAAMWIGAAASEVVVTPSGEAGSIGVISMYADWSKAYKDAGIEVSVMRVPDKKARFSGVEPLTDEMRALVEERLAASYEKFKRAMATNRGIRIDSVQSKFGGGEMLTAEQAVEAGLVDRIATLDSTISKMMTRRAPSGARAQLARALLPS